MFISRKEVYLECLLKVVQGPPYVLGQAILPTTQYQVGILNCSWTQMKDISLYQKKFHNFFCKIIVTCDFA